MKFSLIMATYGRKDEIALFLESLLSQKNIDLNELELIIIDQNDTISLDNIYQKYMSKLNIIHIKSDKRGLSLNRNIGLKLAKGEYIAFPDDDCTYYSDTLYNVQQYFERNQEVDVVLGRIIDKQKNQNIIRNWKRNSCSVNKSNFFFSYSSITIFARKNDILFDENLGVGCLFGSYEDADYVWQMLDKNMRLIYTPEIEVWHPEPKEQEINYQKVYSYGLGFGALIYKHFSFSAIWLFIQAQGYHFSKFCLNLLKGNKKEVRKSWLSLISRFKGMYLYATK
ncbi:glycosyl transferase [Rodentibacter genomosp. 2]|uniref:glycosyltransferase family 2 protein n=1 Tax=Rodentibacter genomosp. 2 TaxID=1908266 RepID=UPI00098523A7|nr:glycosyl transferase [Rodentibacter genomosp. 2]